MPRCIFTTDITPEQVIDNIHANRVYSREFVVINKCDLMKEPIAR